MKAAWNDFDETHRLLTLRDTKNSTDRTIPLSTKAMSVLSALPMTDPRIFPITPEALRSAFKRLCKRLGIVDLNWHDLRHEAVTRLFEKGLTLPEVRLISGHKDIKMLLRYTHLKPSSLLDKLG